VGTVIGWLAVLVVQTITAVLAFRLDREALRPLWALPLQQFVYRQVMYLVLLRDRRDRPAAALAEVAPLRRGCPNARRIVRNAVGYSSRVASSGDLLGGRYRLDDPIAAGGMGHVWRATDTVLGRDVAVKMLHARRAGDPQFQVRFRHEARTMAALHHPGVVGVYDYGEIGDGEGAYLVMAHVDGQPLDERIAATGRLDPAETMSIIAQAARALHAAHTAGIIHRDVKPGNLIVKPDGTVVLVDFGVARSTESTDLTGVDEVVGTALYIAPEQVSKQTIGPATDIYALGAVAYQCLAGHPPFPGDNPVSVAMSHLNDDPPPLPADVPTPVRDLVATAMAKDPANRFAAAAAMAAAAERAAGHDGVAPAPATAPAVAPTEVIAPRRSRRRAAIGWAAAALVALTALGVVLAVANPTGFGPKPGNPPASTQIMPGSAGAPQVEASNRASPGGSRVSAATPTGNGAGPGGGTPVPGTGPTTPANPTTGPTQSATSNPTTSSPTPGGSTGQQAPTPPPSAPA